MYSLKNLHGQWRDYVYLNTVRIYRGTMGLKDRIQDTLPDHILRRVSDHFTVTGSIAVLTLPPDASRYSMQIARAITARHHNIRTVLNKTTRITGDARTAHFEMILGTDTSTTHHEYGFVYRVDVREVFFNPRLARERRRVTAQVSSGERVLVPFSGAGPFVVPAAASGAEVIAVEQNPAACRYLAQNTVMNGVGDRVAILQGNAFDVPRILPLFFDRAIIPTPYGREGIFSHIAPGIRPGGMIHFYTFKNKRQASALAAEFDRNGYEVVLWRRCGNVAPGVSRWVYDLRVTGTASPAIAV